jgi:hypothetical protein
LHFRDGDRVWQRDLSIDVVSIVGSVSLAGSAPRRNEGAVDSGGQHRGHVVHVQIATEAVKFGHDAALSRDGKVAAPITITNYERLERFDTGRYRGVVLDESGILKGKDRKTACLHASLACALLATAQAGVCVDLAPGAAGGCSHIVVRFGDAAAWVVEVGAGGGSDA